MLGKKLLLQDRESLFILISPLIIYGIYIFYPLPLWEHYLLPISILAVFLLALSLQKIFFQGRILQMLVITFLLINLFPTFIWIQDNYLNNLPYQPKSDGSYRNQLEVAKWILDDTKNKDYGYFVYTTGILTYNMDYLLWWLSDKNHLIPPSNQKHPTTYLIFYPHSLHDDLLPAAGHCCRHRHSLLCGDCICHL
jgi:hypothetical protein